MKVLFYIREDYQENLAGDTIQFTKTKEHLAALGIDIFVSHSPEQNLEEYDLIHLFNTIRIADTYRFYLNAVRQRKKILLTPIYWNYLKHIPNWERSQMEELYWIEGNRQRREVFQGVDFILPGSEAEMRQIELDYGVYKPYRVIPNGVEAFFGEEGLQDFSQAKGLKDYLLTVGRVCRHKNQLTLAKITHRLGIPYVIIGPVNHLGYYYECLEANPDLVYFPMVPHHQLRELYQRAHIHGLVSWYEIPGLVNLEAGLSGCHVLTTEVGSTKEYFLNYAHYANPHDPQTIEALILQLMNTPKKIELKHYIQEHFLWPQVVRGIGEVYETLANP